MRYTKQYYDEEVIAFAFASFVWQMWCDIPFRVPWISCGMDLCENFVIYYIGCQNGTHITTFFFSLQIYAIVSL